MVIAKRLEALERDIVGRDNSKRIDMDVLLEGLTGINGGGPKVDKPKQAEPSEPIDFDKMVQTLSDYRKAQAQKKEENEIPQQLIIE